jgi:hypothetical protein
MAAPYRIVGPRGERAARPPLMSGYLEKLMKMIPGEIVGLYLVGSGIIPEGEHAYLLGWSLFCLLALFAVRIAGTRDPDRQMPPQWGAIAVSAVAYVIWIYSLGGPFRLYLGTAYKPFLGSLLVLAWTFVIPLIYTPAD